MAHWRGRRCKAWPTVTNILKNAWIKAFSSDTNDSVDYQDALNRDGEGKSKKELRQERRATRRAGKEKEGN